MHYAISYKNSAGQTQYSEFTPFDTDDAAIAHGERGSHDNPIVEVWKGNHLLIRLEQGITGEAISQAPA
jgi:hypothetical protein